VGPDVGELEGKEAPMAKILFVELVGATEENLYDLYLKVTLSRLEVSLRGYMIRASSPIQREWCRVSREAVRSGISLAHIGAAEIETVKRLPFVKAAEMGMVTLSVSSVAAFSGLAHKAERIASALCKLSREMDHECESCAFSDLCGSLSGLKHLRAMRQKRKRQTE
jgi:CO dehydrogenase/acetyl-CoA synthase beta subunit